MLAAGTQARRLRHKRACQNGLRKTGVLKAVSQAPKVQRLLVRDTCLKKARASLTTKEYAATTAAKRKGTAAGKQFVAQPKKIAAKTAKFRKD
jgi:hypothetical protein